MDVNPAGFESAASASSAIPARRSFLFYFLRFQPFSSNFGSRSGCVADAVLRGSVRAFAGCLGIV
jgi:hypothetical protein